ncbi:MAG TPA: ABC transporter permease, partial [Longimicrobiales bacterium]|nr:ABC transporter permease [Longimicrobiales bacterium]
MTDRPARVAERLARMLVGLAAPLVPQARRKAWREEWESEIWHHVNRGGAGEASAPRGGAALVLRCLGALPHALWIRAEEWNLDTLWQDVRFAFRTLAKRPGFTLVAGLTLALGIGANSAVFSVVNGVVLRPLPIPDADDLVFVWGRLFQGRPTGAVSPPDFRDYRAATRDAFAEFAAYAAFDGTVIHGDEEGQRQELRTRGMTVNLPRLLGWEPALGRGFTETEGEGASSDAVLLSYGAWQRAFGADRRVVGRTIRLGGEPRTVVGVLPEAWAFQPTVDVWTPIQFGTEGFSSRSAHFLRPLGRLAPGMTMADAQASLDRVSARLEAAYPDTNDGWYAFLQPLQQYTVGSTATALLMIMGAVALVLLVACGNVAGLFLARAAGRRGEVALRSALGAPRGRVVRQLLVESVLLSLGSGVVGVAMAFLGVRALKGMAPGYIPRLDEVGVDGTV